MEEAIGDGIDFEPCDCGYRIIIHMAHHVMPLQIWCRTMPSMKPPNPSPYSSPDAFGGGFADVASTCDTWLVLSMTRTNFQSDTSGLASVSPGAVYSDT